MPGIITTSDAVFWGQSGCVNDRCGRQRRNRSQRRLAYTVCVQLFSHRMCCFVCFYAVAPERIWKWGGAHVFLVSLHFFWLSVYVLVSDFVMVSTVWSVSCLLFFHSQCPQCPAICKLGGTCPHAFWSRRHCFYRVVQKRIPSFSSIFCFARWGSHKIKVWWMEELRVYAP